MKHNTIFYIPLLILFLSAGCSDWLDVELVGSMTDKEIFENEDNAYAALNGIYMDLCSEKLYGGHMALSTIEYYSHYFFSPTEDPGVAGGTGEIGENSLRLYYWMGSYNYKENKIKSRNAEIWEKGYAVIFNLNVFIDKIKEVTFLSEAKKNILLGEAYGLRAYIHFDLFRLFGPVYKENKTDLSIPYNDQPVVSTLDNLPANQFLEKLLQDIELAAKYLENDPVLSNGVGDIRDASQSPTDVFMNGYRNKRFNYYAVLALQARVLLYQDEVQKAGTLAGQILEELEKKELFQDMNKVTAVKNGDYVFYTEVLFGLHNVDLNKVWKNSMDNTEVGKVNSVHPDNLLLNIFVSEESVSFQSEDVRANQWYNGAVDNQHYLSRKYTTINLADTMNVKNYQPLFRKAELSYILAEAYLEAGNIPDAAKAIYDVQSRRGIQVSNREAAVNPANASEDALYEILQREYYKEFFAEGQSFFFLKRRNMENIINQGKSGALPMQREYYVVPLPESETNI